MYEMFLFNSVNSKITQNVNEEFILKYSDYSCEQLNSLWKEVGLGSYYNGLFKVIEPNDLKDIINQCYIMDDDESLLPFMCTAFGDVFAYVKNKKFGNYVVFLFQNWNHLFWSHSAVDPECVHPQSFQQCHY